MTGGANLFRLDGKIAAVIGAGSGIGEAVAIGAAGQGATVACLDANEGAARAVADRIGGAASAAAVDVRSSESVEGAFGAVATAHGRLDIVVCTPGVNVRKPLLSYTDDEFDRVIAVNLRGTFNVLRAAAEFGPSGVRVNAVGPGVVETPLTAPIKANPSWYEAYAAKSVFKRWARADEMVGPTLFLASDAASYVTGIVLFADGGWTAADGRFMPPGM